MNFCEILHEFLKDNDMTQRLFAERVGVKQSQVSEWLSGKAQPCLLYTSPSPRD